MDESDSFFTSDSDQASAVRFGETTPLSESRRGFCRLSVAIIDGRRVVLKSLKEKHLGSVTHAQLLKKEYDLCRGLYHPNVVSVFGFIEHPRLGPSIVMEFIDGSTLANRLKQSGPMEHEEAMTTLRQLCDVIAYMHASGIVHRDLKPSNIMLTRYGSVVKIIDFGLSDGSTFTDFKLAGGTRNYSAPEQLDGSSGPSSRADVYSLGVIMEEMCANPSGPYKSTARLCCSKDPYRRPADVDRIIPLITAGEKRRLLYRTAAIIAAALVVALLAFFSLRNHAPAPPATPPADTATAPIATPSDTVPSPAPESPSAPAVVPSPKPGDEIIINQLTAYARKYTTSRL